MKREAKGWVVINAGHPRTGSQFILPETFRRKRTDAIKTFVDGSGDTWNYWKHKFNFRVVRATQTISTKEL